MIFYVTEQANQCVTQYMKLKVKTGYIMKTIVKNSIKGLMAGAVAFVGLNTAAYAGEVLKRDTVFTIKDFQGTSTSFPMGIYDVDGNTLTEQSTIDVPTPRHSAVGLAVSTKNKLIFVSHEASDTVDVINGASGEALPDLQIPGTSNIAGIVVSESRNRFYAVDRHSTNIFVYDMKSDGTVTRVPGEEFLAEAGVTGIDVWGNKLYCTHYNNIVTIYDLDAKSKVDEYTTTSSRNMAIAVDGSDSNNVMVYTTWTNQYIYSSTVTQYNVNTKTEKFIVLGRDGRGLSVNPALGLVYAVTGDSSDSTAPELRTYGEGQFTLVASSPTALDSEALIVGRDATDVLAVGITFDPDLTIEITDPADKNVEMCTNVTFEINITNPSLDQALIVDDMEDNYDATVMRFLSSSVTPSDSTDDGNITWESLNQTIEPDSIWTFTKTFYAYEGATPTFETLKVTSAELEDGTPVAIDNTIYFDIEYSETPCIIEVALDVHPTSCPNPLNKKAKGVTPMAILGTADFDVTTINVSSLRINGVSPVESALEDVATPYEGGFSDPVSRDECSEAGADEIMDLTLKFDTQAILENVDKDVQMMEITGETWDGTPITGQDVVWVK